MMENPATHGPSNEAGGISTRTLLIAVMVLAVVCITVGSLFAIRQRIHNQVSVNIAADLARSVTTFTDVQEQHLRALRRENALLADLPSLKALLTTNDERTIVDGGVEFWKTSGNDLFALLAKDGTVRTVYTQGRVPTDAFRGRLSATVQQTNTQYVLGDGELFEYSVQPVYFGDQTTGTLLGYVVLGDAIDTSFLKQISRPAMAQLVFFSGSQMIADTLQPMNIEELAAVSSTLPVGIEIHGERYLAVSRDLSSVAAAPLRLVILKSLRAAEKNESEINRRVLLVGLIALLIGGVLMALAAASMTAPLERLARSVRAFGEGNMYSELPQGGTREVRQLSEDFAHMRRQIQAANEALVESERLATIGRMASSVSHDLRHYLAAVYANAEFLASPNLTERERAELYEEITAAVKGTTELIDSLLIFSKTNGQMQRSLLPLSATVKRAIALVEAHPDAAGVRLTTSLVAEGECVVAADAKQLERALYNLLLNGCQAAREGRGPAEVHVDMRTVADSVTVRVTDSGPGVADGVRESMFEPFVSEGKQKGTGLGLTLTLCIAQEHGGTVRLESSQPGKTTFAILLARNGHTMRVEESVVATGGQA